MFSLNIFIPLNSFALNPNFKINKSQKQEIKKLHKRFSKQDKIIPANIELKTEQNNFISENNDIKINYKIRNKKINYSNKRKGNLEISIVNNNNFDSVDVLDNKILYSGENSKIDALVESVDGGLRQILNIKSIEAPNFYDFEMSLTDNDKIVMNQDGSASIQKQNGEIKMLILKPWAKDADDQDLVTWYEIVNNSILRQRIDFKNAKFPVTADPTWCGDIIKSSKWLWTNVYKNEWKETATVDTTWCGKVAGNGLLTSNPLIQAPQAWFAWTEFYNKTPYHHTWNWEERKYGTSKYWSMYNQFICHFINPYVITKYQKNDWFWRIDPWRPDVGWARTYLAGCNPE